MRALERLAVQLCAAWGARVTCVAPRYTHEYLLSLGAACVVADDMEEVERVARSGQRWVDICRHIRSSMYVSSRWQDCFAGSMLF